MMNESNPPASHDSELNFDSSEMFGTNYQQGIRDPRQQELHEIHVGNTPAPDLSFEDSQYTSSYMKPSQGPSSPTHVTLDPHPEGISFETPIAQQTQSDVHKNAKFWNIEYWQFLFNVNTREVGARIGKSLVPYPNNFLASVSNNPDLYGPFWIASTLVFMLAATGNTAAYFNSDEATDWTFDSNKLSFAAAAIYGYLVVIPPILYFILRYYKIQLKLLDIICIYGYSFFIYIPISILCVIPVNGLRWGLVGLAAIVSILFLVVNFYKVLHGNMGKGVFILAGVVALHLAFALTCQLYFFQYA